MWRTTQLFLIGLLVAIANCTGCAPREPITFRVLTYNIHHGEGMDGKIDLERIADVIRRSQADLVALQEVDRGVGRSGGVDQPAKLAALTDMQAVFEKNIDVQGGEYGNAVLSRFPVVSHQNHSLPNVPGNEQRGLLEVRVQIDGEKLAFCVTHFDHQANDGERIASVAALRELIGNWEETPVIVAGDLNATPESRVVRQMRSFLRDTSMDAKAESPSFPADAPDRQIDYIFYKALAGLRSAEHHVMPESVASDHRPVVAAFTLDPRH